MTEVLGMAGLTTLDEKIARLGELMAKGRIERELGVRIATRTNGDGGTEYMVEFLNSDGTIKSTRPCDEYAYRIQATLFILANELASEITAMASKLRQTEGLRIAALQSAQAEIERAARDLHQAGHEARADGFLDGWNAMRAAVSEKLVDHRVYIGERIGALGPNNILTRGQSVPLRDVQDKLDRLAASITMLNPKEKEVAPADAEPADGEQLPA